MAEANARVLGTELWNSEASVAGKPALNGAWFASVSDNLYRQFATKYRARFGTAPFRLSSLGYDSVLLTVRIARDWPTGAAFPRTRLRDRRRLCRHRRRVPLRPRRRRRARARGAGDSGRRGRHGVAGAEPTGTIACKSPCFGGSKCPLVSKDEGFLRSFPVRTAPKGRGEQDRAGSRRAAASRRR